MTNASLIKPVPESVSDIKRFLNRPLTITYIANLYQNSIAFMFFFVSCIWVQIVLLFIIRFKGHENCGVKIFSFHMYWNLIGEHFSSNSENNLHEKAVFYFFPNADDFLVIRNCKNIVFMKDTQREQSCFRIETAKSMLLSANSNLVYHKRIDVCATRIVLGKVSEVFEGFWMLTVLLCSLLRYIGKSDSITISVWNHKKIHKKQGAGFLGCVRLLSNSINRLKDTGCKCCYKS